MTWKFVRRNPTRYQRNVQRVLYALRDEKIAARLAEFAEVEHERDARTRDLAARKAWLERFANWDGETPGIDEMAEQFAESMAGALTALSDTPDFYVLDRAGVVAEALDACEESRAYQRSPGRARLSAALRALGFDAKAVDRMLDFDRKA